MGIFESIKSAFSGKAEQQPEAVTSPSQALRNAGIDPGKLKFAFSTGTISVSGEMADAAERQKILDVLAGLPDISTVQDHMTVAAAQPPAPPESPAAPDLPPASGTGAADRESDTDPEDGANTYTVQAGDTLWKIAQESYGDGSKYMKIFEANTHVLKDPDQIYPGQELTIPKL